MKLLYSNNSGLELIQEVRVKRSFIGDNQPNIDTVNEAMFLYAISTVGICLNLLVIISITVYVPLRKATNSFIAHACFLDLLKCLYCIPFATSLLRDAAPIFCTALGGSYVVIVTASGFNILAMVCCEAYSFSEHHIARHPDSNDKETHSSVCCIAFGVAIVYLGSIIIHLGPTIIGGDFNYNDLIGNCIFVYGTIKSYVVHCMWIIIMTLAMSGAIYYQSFFYRHVQSHSTHRLATLVRASIAVSQCQTINVEDIRRSVRNSLSRTRVLLLVTALFILCWYPLFVLTLVDPMFKRPKKIYKLLTFVAWSNSSLNPLVFVLFDRNIDLLRHFVCCCRYFTVCYSYSQSSNASNSSNSLDNQREVIIQPQPLTVITPTILRSSPTRYTSPRQAKVDEHYKRVGDRLFAGNSMYTSDSYPKCSESHLLSDSPIIHEC